jgi:hypothetical protein
MKRREGMLRKFRRKWPLVLLASGLTIGVGVAIAAGWLVSSTGNGGSTVGTLSAPVVTANAAVGGGSACVPNTTCSLGIHVVNSSGNPALYLSSITVDGSTFAVDAGHAAGCSVSGNGYTTTGTLGISGHTGPTDNDVIQLPTPRTVTVASGASTDLTVPGVIAVDAAAPTGCQGATVTVTGLQFNWSTSAT